jgi:hypothetical protein
MSGLLSDPNAAEEARRRAREGLLGSTPLDRLLGEPDLAEGLRESLPPQPGQFLTMPAPLRQSPPPRTVGEQALHSFGLGVRNVAEGLLSMPALAADVLAYPVNLIHDEMRREPARAGQVNERQPLFPSQRQAVSALLDRLGLPRAETAQERIVGRIVEDVAGAAIPFGTGRAITGLAGDVAPIIGRALTEAPVAQVTGAAGSGLAGGVAREVAPDSNLADLSASLAGGALGSGIPGILRWLYERAAAMPPRVQTGAQSTAADGLPDRSTTRPETGAAQAQASNDNVAWHSPSAHAPESPSATAAVDPSTAGPAPITPSAATVAAPATTAVTDTPPISPGSPQIAAAVPSPGGPAGGTSPMPQVPATPAAPSSGVTPAPPASAPPSVTTAPTPPNAGSPPPSTGAPTITTGTPAVGWTPMPAQQALQAITAKGPKLQIPALTGAALRQAERDEAQIGDYLRVLMTIPPSRRPLPPQQAGALPLPVQGTTVPVPQVMADRLNATRIENFAPHYALPHTNRQGGRGDLTVLAPHVDAVVQDLAQALDPAVVRLARGERVSVATPAQVRMAGLAEHFNLRPLYDALLAEGFTPQQAAARLLQEGGFVAANSMLTNTEAALRGASLFASRAARGEPIDAASMRALLESEAGLNIMPDRHSPQVQRVQGGDLTLGRHTKSLTYQSALSGDWSAVPIDTHFMRIINTAFNRVAPGSLPRASFATESAYQRYQSAYADHGMGLTNPQLHDLLARAPGGQRIAGLRVPTEYTFYHDIVTRVAHQLQLSPAQTHALLWFHFGDQTGLMSPRLTQIDLLNWRLEHAAAALNRSVPHVAQGFFRNELRLPAIAGIAGVGTLEGLLDPGKDATNPPERAP